MPITSFARSALTVLIHAEIRTLLSVLLLFFVLRLSIQKPREDDRARYLSIVLKTEAPELAEGP